MTRSRRTFTAQEKAAVVKCYLIDEGHVSDLCSNIGCWNFYGWLYSMVELECWDQHKAHLVILSDRPRNVPNRRPSHNDQRRQIARKMLRETFFERSTGSYRSENNLRAY